MTATPTFAYEYTDNPADLLDNACAVLCFLGETAGGFHSEGLAALGLSERGCHGLTLILHGVENTVKQAAQQL